MSNNSVGGAGATPTPYSTGVPNQIDQTGQTNDQRKVNLRNGEKHIPDRSNNNDASTPAPSPLSKRKVAHHDNKLRHLPGSGEGFKPLGGNPAPTADPETKQTSPNVVKNPKVTVESSGGLTPLPRLNKEQQEDKNKLVGAFTQALGFIKQHKNTFAMGGGAALMVAGIALMAFPPTAAIGIFPAVLGFSMAVSGFSFAMMNVDNGGPGPTPPPEQPKNEKKEEGDNDEKKKERSGEGTSPSSSSTSTPKGYFAKIDRPTGEVASGQAEADETSAQLNANQLELLNLQRHMEAQLQKAIEDDFETHDTGEFEVSASLEEKILDIAAEFAVRAGLEATDEVMEKIVESGKLIAQVMADAEGKPLEEQQRAFQSMMTSLAARSDIPGDAVLLLSAGFDSILENQKDRLNDAVKNVLSHTSALLKAVVAEKKSSLTPQKTFSLAELEAAISGIHDPGKELENIVHMRQLKDAIEEQGLRAKMTETQVKEIKERLYTDALDLLSEKMEKEEFTAALVAKVDPFTRRIDLDFLNNALKGHVWFKGSV